MTRRSLLVCFDAFGTLFTPKRPVHQQYGEVARALGLSGFSDEQVESSFKAAFKEQTKQNPNFGKANGLNAERWWTKIINNTFQPLVGTQQQLPTELVPKLLHRFWSNEGYVLMQGVQKLLRRLRQHYSADELVVGVVTNSDGRAPDVLSSLGVSVSPLRVGSQPKQHDSPDRNYDIDFSVMSYDVGHEKPDRRIFTAAEEMLETVLKARHSSMQLDRESWQKVYVGDEYAKDVVGALGAGWNAVFIGHQSEDKHTEIEWLNDRRPGNLQTLFDSSRAVGFSSLDKLAGWLPREK